MNIRKRLWAALLTAVMILSLGMNALAAEPEARAVKQQGSLTVTAAGEQTTLKGQTIKLYKLFDLTVSGGDKPDRKYAYTVNEKYRAALAEVLELPDSAISEEIYNKLQTWKTDTDGIQKFANDFTLKLKEKGLTATETKKVDSDEKKCTFDVLDYGYYLVYQQGMQEIQSSLISVQDADNTVNLKATTPSIEKEVKEETAEIGQVVKYTVKGKIPDISLYNPDTYVYKIHDTLSDGLDFTDEAGKVAAANYTVKIQIVGEAEESVTANLSASNVDTPNLRKMELNLSKWVKDNQTNKGKDFTVTYWAKVNEEAIVTNQNKAELEYGNTPNDTITTTPVEAVTSTYPLQIKKTEQGNNDIFLAGAKFSLYKSEGSAIAGKDAIEVKAVTAGVAGDYVVATGQTDTITVMETVTAVAPDTYNLKLNGLAAGEYWLVETEAPDGYNKLTAPVKLTIERTGDSTWEITKEGEAAMTGPGIIVIENSTGSVLPETGGMGTILFTVVGMVMILGVVVSFLFSRRKVK